ncbi:Transducin beta-like protein 2 [Zea mays]|uniref:Transducin beta-like protein 2 n=1 Tax=Zea mays TaxID=4577 RepID=A0A317Y268_MAIZE|nr:hypothetical protein Zm00014a_013619 [Zea mays]PWZ52729.1 Transducin beta-like protein 2 [Zea mays]
MAASLVSSFTVPLVSAVLGAAIALVFLAGYLRRKRAAIAHIPPTETAAAPDQPKHVRPSNQAQYKKGHLRPHHHAADKDAAKKHHHLDVNTLRGHTDSVTALAFSNDACNLVTVCADGAIRVFRIDDTSSKSFKILRINLPAGAHPTAVTFSEGSSSVVVAAQALLGSSLYMYADVSAPPTAENKLQGKLSPPEIKWSHPKIHGKESVLNLAAARATHGSGDGSTIIISCSEATDIKVWHGKSGKEFGTVDTNQLKNNMADISPNGRFIAAAAFTADVKVWEIVYSKDGSVKEVNKVMQLKGHKSAVTCLCFAPNSEQIITASKDGSIRVWNINGMLYPIRLQRNKHNKVTRTKWWKLKGDVAQTFKERVIEEGPWAEEGDANNMWRKMVTCIRKIASEEFGLSQGNRREVKDTWWWNEDVQKAIKEKKDCYKRLHHDKCADNIEKYRIAKKSAKRAVSRARGQAYDALYQRLDTKQGEKDIYRMAKIRERKTRDVNQVKCIKDEANQLLVKNEEIKNRWKEYFNKLFNGGNESSTIELDEPFDDNNRGFVRRIQEYEVKEALKRMKVGKAMGPDVRYHLDEDPKTLRVMPIPLHDSKGSVCQYDHMTVSPDGKILAVTSGSTLQWLLVETGAVLDTADKAHEGDITGIAWAPRTIPNGGVHVFILATAGVDKKVKLWTAPDVGST